MVQYKLLPVSAALHFWQPGQKLPARTPHKELDISLHREFRASDRITLQFRAEAFNITNTPTFGAPGAAYAPGSATFGVISSAGLPRNIQLALKMLF